MSDPLKDIHGRSFVEGQDAIAKELSARRFKELVMTNEDVGKVAAGAIDQADQLAVDGNPHKQRLARLIKESVVGAVEELTSGRLPAEEGWASAEAAPFSNSSPSSSTSLDGSTPKSLPHEPPQPKRRGRPPKNRS